MKNMAADSYSLDVFEGPLSFLLHLIQKSEIDILDIPIQELTDQYLLRFKEMMTPSVDTGAEFIGTAAWLMWMKSKTLLPKHDQLLEEEEDMDPGFEIIYKLLEYCRFKEGAKILSQKEHEQSVFHTRGVHSIPEAKKNLGIEHLSLEDLEKLFQDALSRAANEPNKIHEEMWRVSDKIALLRALVKRDKRVGFEKLFFRDKPKTELIVTFLAVLELIKIGEVFIARETETNKILIISKEQP